MMSLRLTSEEAEIISIVAPCVAIIGPLVAGPLADKLAGGSGGKPRSKNGMYLKIMLAICLILSAIFSWLLMAVPTIVRLHTIYYIFLLGHNSMIAFY